MAGAQKVFTLLFQLQASLSGNFNSSFTNAQNAARRLQGELSNINTLQNKIGGYQKQAQAIEENRNKLAALTEEQSRLQREMSQTEQPSEALRRAYERNARQIQQTTARIEEQQDHLDELGNELRDAGVDTDRLTEENDRLADSYNRVRQNQERLTHLADAQKKNAAAISKTKAQLAGTIGVISAVGAAIYAGPVQQSIQFQSSMAKVGTIADAQKVPLNALQKDIISLSNEVGVNANAIADDVYNAISAGQKTEDAVGFVGQAVKLAKGGFAETGQALDVMTTILNAYGKESSEAGIVADMLIQTQNKGKVTVAELSSVMGKIIPTANANNVALEQLCAGYAIMTSKGIAAAESTTYMNSMLNELGKTGTKADKALKSAAGAGFKDLMASGKSLAEVLDILQVEADKSGLSLADMFGSAEAGKAALTLMGDGVEGFNEQVDGMLNSTGAAESAYKKMAETTAEKITNAKNALNNLAIVLGETFLPYVTTGALKVSELVSTFSAWAQENPEILKTIMKVAGGLAAFKVGALGAKLGFQELHGGVLAAQTIFTLFQGRAASAGVESIGLLNKLKAAGRGIRSYFGSLGGAMGGLFNASAFGRGILSIGSTLKGTLFNALTAVGGRFTSIFTGVGRLIINGPLGRIGSVIGSGLGNIKTFFAPLTNVITTALAPLGKLGSTLFGSFGGVLGKILPMAGAITLVVAGVRLLMDHLDEVRGFIGRVFGPAGVEVFDKVIGTIANIGNAIKGVFSEGNLGQARGFIQKLFGDNGVAVFNGLITIVQTLGNIFREFISFVDTNVKPVLENIFGFITETVLPLIAQKFVEWAPTIANIIQELWTVISGVATQVMNVVNFLMPTIQAVIGTALDSIMGLISGFLNAIKGVLDFVVGVFTGDWQKAWEGMKNIFSGVWQGLGAITKAPLNFIISGINTLIRGLNGIKIPDWVPGIGGKGINIPQIPMLAKGSRNSPDTFIAGEKGPELITNSKGRTVFTAMQTGQILNNANAVLTPATTQAPTLQAAPAQGGTVLQFTSAPVFHVNGGNLEEVREMFEEWQRDTMNKIDEIWRQKENDERRVRYE